MEVTSNLLIQVNFLLISSFFIFCLKDKNYNLHFKYFVKENKNQFILYFIFILFIISNITFTN